MKRLTAFLIDHIILSILFITAVFYMTGFTGSLPEDRIIWIFVISGLLCYLGYFFVCDYFFQGMTIGKRVLGLRMQWVQPVGIGKAREVILHILFKGIFIIIWPFSLIAYFSAKGKLPYDRMLGILYLSDEEDGNGKILSGRNLVRVVAGILVTGAVMSAGLFLVLQNIVGKAFYSLGEARIASVSMVLGEKRLAGYSFSGHSSSAEVKYRYRVDDGAKLGKRYAEYLVREEGFEAVEGNPWSFEKTGDGGTYQIRMELAASSKYLQVILYYDEKP